MPEGDPLAYAVAADANVSKLATELAKSGADDATIAGLNQVADILRGVITALGSGQLGTPPPRVGPEPSRAGQYDQATAGLQADMQASQ